MRDVLAALKGSRLIARDFVGTQKIDHYLLPNGQVAEVTRRVSPKAPKKILVARPRLQ